MWMIIYGMWSDMNAQADALVSSGQFDSAGIGSRRAAINDRFERVKNLAAHRRARLNEANTLHQFFRDIADEESWIKLVVYDDKNQQRHLVAGYQILQ